MLASLKEKKKSPNPFGFFLQQILFSIFCLGLIQEKNDLSHSSNEFLFPFEL